MQLFGKVGVKIVYKCLEVGTNVLKTEDFLVMVQQVLSNIDLPWWIFLQPPAPICEGWRAMAFYAAESIVLLAFYN